MTVGELVTLLRELEDQDMEVLIPCDKDMDGEYATPLFVDVVGGVRAVIDFR